MSTLFERVFAGSDGVYAAAQGVIDDAIAKAGADAAIKLDTAYSLPCYYAVTGVKVSTLGEMKEALEGTVKSLMTREKRTKDIFTSGVGTADRGGEVHRFRGVTLSGSGAGAFHGRPDP